MFFRFSLILFPAASVLLAACAHLPKPQHIVGARPDVAKLVKRDITRDFGAPQNKAEWFTQVKTIEVDGTTVRVRTPLIPDRNSVQVATSMCSAVSDWVFADGHGQLNLHRVEVFDAHGQAFVTRRSYGDSCAPS